MAAAVSDWKPKTPLLDKIKKEDLESWNLELIKTPDIISQINHKKLFKIGIAHSCQKINKVPINKYDKKLDIIITEKYILR